MGCTFGLCKTAKLNTMHKNKKGFIGLLVLLLATAIIVMLFVKIYLSSEEKGVGTEVQNLLPAGPDGSVPKTRLEQLNSAKEAAEDVQGTVDAEGKKMEGALKGEGL